VGFNQLNIRVLTEETQEFWVESHFGVAAALRRHMRPVRELVFSCHSEEPPAAKNLAVR